MIYEILARLTAQSSPVTAAASVADLVKTVKGLLSSYTFDSGGKKFKGATMDDVKASLKGGPYAKVPVNLSLQLMLRKEGLNVITLTGKREGRGKDISFWSVKK